MARLPRLYAPATVQYIVQRPALGRALFVDADDYALFVDLVEEAVKDHSVALHAYALLPTQVRLLATPANAEAIARLMQSIGRRYVPYLNRKTGRDGALWDRRYRSTLIDADAFLLPAMRHVEGMSVTEGLVAESGAWRWSSHAHHVGDVQQPFISDHARYWALSDTPFERQAIYRTLASEALDPALAGRIAQAVQRGWVLGDAPFIQRLEGAASRRMEPLRRGRRRRETG